MSAKQLRACVYARFSTENQSADSIADQIRECERIAEREGLEIVERFSDAALSAGTTQRPGYQDMLTAARARHFSVIICEDISRLWRNRAEFGPRSAELEDLGVHMLTCTGDDTRRDGWGLTVQIKQAMAEAARREASYRTRRGLEGRARAGKSTGGRAYGFRCVEIGPPERAGERPQTELQVDPETAPTVLRIFSLYADGVTCRRICEILNSEGVPSPGAFWKRTDTSQNAKRKGSWVASALHGERSRGTGILNNPRYVGRVTWGRATWRRGVADSKKRTMVMNAAPTCEIVDERLRIVPQELWDRVKRRQAVINRASVKIRTALADKGGHPLVHLLSGLLVCSRCGSRFVAVNSREYGCSTFKNGGRSACTNAVRLNRAGVEQELIAHVREELLSPEAIELAIATYTQALEHGRRGRRRATPANDGRIVKLDAEIDQLKTLVRAGTLSQGVAAAAIERAEEERRELKLAGDSQDRRTAETVIELKIPAAVRDYRRLVDALPATDLPKAERIEARAALHELVGHRVVVEDRGPGGVRLVPQAEAADVLLKAAGAEGVSNPPGPMVAGAGFEPATFGL